MATLLEIGLGRRLEKEGAQLSEGTKRIRQAPGTQRLKLPGTQRLRKGRPQQQAGRGSGLFGLGTAILPGRKARRDPNTVRAQSVRHFTSRRDYMCSVCSIW